MKRIILSLCIIAFAFSCTSDDEESTPEPQSNFYGLQVGNSWSYNIYQHNSQTQTLEYYGADQDVFVVSMETIEGNSFYKLKIVTSGVENNSFLPGNGETFQYRRIEDGTLFDEYNRALFVNNDFSERLMSEESWGSIYNQNLEELATVTVEAGEFTCNQMLVYAKTPEGEQLLGLDNYYYAEGIGLVSSSVSLVSGGQILYKTVLNSYSIQ
ncbi:hypothetical protein [Lacinutrix undariae]